MRKRNGIQNTKYKNQRGFTILESIVAILVLSLSVSGVFSAVQQSLSQAIIAKDEVKAFYLAQEAVEIIRNKRDINQLDKINGGSRTWLDGIIDKCSFGSICTVEAISFNNIVNCGSEWGNCPFLKQNLNQSSNTFSLYGYNSAWTDTNFKREIKIERVRDDLFGNPVEIAVVVRIFWTKGSKNMEFKAKTYLFNWI